MTLFLGGEFDVDLPNNICSKLCMKRGIREKYPNFHEGMRVRKNAAIILRGKG